MQDKEEEPTKKAKSAGPDKAPKIPDSTLDKRLQVHCMLLAELVVLELVIFLLVAVTSVFHVHILTVVLIMGN